MKHQLAIGMVAAMFALPLAAQAQGVPGGISHGVSEGNRIAGPVGAVVGGAVGGVIGGVQWALGVDYVPPTYSDEPPRVYRHRKAAHLHSRHPRKKRPA
jgi:hypothetical protein